MYLHNYVNDINKEALFITFKKLPTHINIKIHYECVKHHFHL